MAEDGVAHRALEGVVVGEELEEFGVVLHHLYHLRIKSGKLVCIHPKILKEQQLQITLFSFLVKSSFSHKAFSGGAIIKSSLSAIITPSRVSAAEGT